MLFNHLLYFSDYERMAKECILGIKETNSVKLTNRPRMKSAISGIRPSFADMNIPPEIFEKVEETFRICLEGIPLDSTTIPWAPWFTGDGVVAHKVGYDNGDNALRGEGLIAAPLLEVVRGGLDASMTCKIIPHMEVSVVSKTFSVNAFTQFYLYEKVSDFSLLMYK